MLEPGRATLSTVSWARPGAYDLGLQREPFTPPAVCACCGGAATELVEDVQVRSRMEGDAAVSRTLAVSLPYCAACAPQARRLLARRHHAGGAAVPITLLVGSLMSLGSIVLYMNNEQRLEAKLGDWAGWAFMALLGLAIYLVWRTSRWLTFRLLLWVPRARLEGTPTCTLPVVVYWEDPAVRLLCANPAFVDALRAAPCEEGVRLVEHSVGVKVVRGARGETDISGITF